MIIDTITLAGILADALNDSKLYSYGLVACAEVQYLTGCRANEALEFSRWQVLGNGNIQLQPQKGNNLRVFDPSIQTCRFFQDLIKGENACEGIFYRKYCYYLEKVLGSHMFTIGDKGVNSPLFRHNYARVKKLLGSTDNEIRIMLGEVTQQSADHYIYSEINWIG